MIRIVLALLATGVLLAGEPPPALPAAYAAYGEQARALAPPGTTRPAAIAALHAFVRDHIRETPTSWG